MDSWKARFRGWGYQPIFCSVESGHNIDLLAFQLRDQTTVVVGPSGVGKSSLINALRSNPRTCDTADGENWFEPVCFFFSTFHVFYYVYDFGICFTCVPALFLRF
jgi:ribosome biogenesis GTPase / thiamine phosphate phosphatase